MVRPVGAGNKIIRIFGRKFFPQPRYAAVQMAGTLRPDGGSIIAGNGIQQNIMFRHNIAKIANGHKIQHAEPRIAVLRSLDQLPQLVFAGGKDQLWQLIQTSQNSCHSWSLPVARNQLSCRRLSSS